MKRIIEPIDIFVIAIFVSVAFVLGLKPLEDLDLGWHLAGGLWMFENGRVPTLDPFNGSHAYWVCYSWIVELIYAAVFRFGGFSGLQWLQSAVAMFSVIVCFLFLRELGESIVEKSFFKQRLIELIAVFFLLVAITPLWYLRPQLVSICFFMLLMVWAEKSLLLRFRTLVLTVFWANIHVYWILVPFIIGVYEVLGPIFNRKPIAYTLIAMFWVLSTCAAGAISPYGFQNIYVVFQYLFEHKIAYALIQEFQPLSPGKYTLYFCLVMIAVLSVLIRSRELVKRKHLHLFVLFILFSFLAFKRIKFIPLFFVVWAVIYMKVVAKPLVDRVTKSSIFDTVTDRHSSQRVTQRSRIILCLYLLLIVLIFERPPGLPLKYQELFLLVNDVAASRVINVATSDEIGVLNHFNDGGWLALALKLAAYNIDNPQRFVTSIDGRTLVMGERRLKQFNRVQFLKPGWCNVVNEWNTSIAILPLDMKLTGAFEGKEGFNEPCTNDWELYKSGEYYKVFVKSDVKVKTN